MAISKSAAVAGVLGGGGGAAGTVAVVKYVTSKEESPLDKVRKDIEAWTSENGGCAIKVKLSTDDKVFKDVNQVENKADLDGLYSSLQDSTKSPTAASTCGTAKSPTKFMLATKGANNSWTFSEIEKTAIDLQEAKNKVSDWAKENGKCTIKVKLSQDGSEQEIDQVTEADKTNLDELYKFLDDSTKNSEAKTTCANSKTASKSMLATKKNDNTGWQFTQSS